MMLANAFARCFQLVSGACLETLRDGRTPILRKNCLPILYFITMFLEDISREIYHVWERFNDDRWNECSFKHVAEYGRKRSLANPHIGGRKHINIIVRDGRRGYKR